jgi:hypothetical protein
MTQNADYEGTAARWQEFARKLMDDLCPICGERFGENPREHVACLLLSHNGSSGSGPKGG